MKDLNALLWKLEGLHTVDTVMNKLNLKRQSAINLLSKLKKLQHCKVSGGGKQPRFYKISMKKILPRQPGMFDILNKCNPNFQLMHWYDHQVHGKYTVEDAIVDAIETKSFRAILATLRCFMYVKDWRRLIKLAKERDCYQKVGALYDVARLYFGVKNINFAPEAKRWRQFTYLKKKNYPKVGKKWKVYIPFNPKDVWEVRVAYT